MRIRHFVAVVLAVGVLTGCANGPTSTSGTSNSGTGSSAGLDASWAEHYSTVAELKKHSDLAVQGTIAKMIKESVDAKGIPSREYQVDVSKTILDPQHRLTGSSLTLVQTGGLVNGKVFQVSDDPLYTVGDQVVLFLKEGTKGLFHVVGGPNGRYTVTGSTVKPFSPQTAKATATTTAAFASEVKNS